MKKFFALLTIAIFATATTGCEKNEDAPTDGQEATRTQAEGDEATAEQEESDEAEGKPEQNADEGEKVAMVEVPAQGKEFDPAVEKSRVPDGVWICDMGTVHWAAAEKPEDGKCPVCGMLLKKHEHAGDSAK
jgi:rubrerythrin